MIIYCTQLQHCVTDNTLICSPNLTFSRHYLEIVGLLKRTFTVRAVSLEPFRAVTLVGAWSVGAVGVGVTRLLSLAFIDI